MIEKTFHCKIIFWVNRILSHEELMAYYEKGTIPTKEAKI